MSEEKKVCREIVTVGLPLPNLLEYTADVSRETRECLNNMKHFSKKHGVETHEIRARSINVAANHSSLVEKMIGDWILIVGSDHSFSPETLVNLLDATQAPPYPKILGTICNYRVAPYRWTNGVADESGERFFPLVPYYNVDPAIMSSGEIQEVDVVGSGVTLYHRSVFDTVPYPHFTYEPRRPSMLEIEEVLRDWDGDERFDEMLERLSGKIGEDDRYACDDTPGISYHLSDADAIRLKEKAKGLRRLLAKFRRPSSIGMDFQICLKARDYGIKSYLHWGVQTHHLTLEHTTPLRYVQWVESDRKNWKGEVMSRNDLTFESIAVVRKLEEDANRKRKEWEEEVRKYREEEKNEADSEGIGVDDSGRQGERIVVTQDERPSAETTEQDAKIEDH